jgi:hypothetical protein
MQLTVRICENIWKNIGNMDIPYTLDTIQLEMKVKLIRWKKNVFKNTDWKDIHGIHSSEGVKKMDKKEIEFEFERATKNTYRFQEKATGSPVIGTLYVQKSVFGSKEPKKVKVTLEWE